MLGKDVVLALERTEVLKKVMQEAGAVLYSQSGQAEKGGPYAETRREASESHANVGSETGGSRPNGAGPRGKVVDAEYKKSDKTGSIP